jgi:CheY-like chemotaxis protein
MKKILLVEDFEIVRTLVNELLTLYGFIVLEAENGTVGLKLAKEEKPDLIISDCNMPELDGMELLEKIRKDKSTHDTPFIFLSGNLSIQNITRGKELGVSAFLAKPFKPEELLKAVQIVLPGKG